MVLFFFGKEVDIFVGDLLFDIGQGAKFINELFFVFGQLIS